MYVYYICYIHIFHIHFFQLDTLPKEQKEIIDNFNKFEPKLNFNLSFTHVHSRINYPVLDLNVKILDGKTVADLHIKTTPVSLIYVATYFPPLNSQ